MLAATMFELGMLALPANGSAAITQTWILRQLRVFIHMCHACA